MFGFALDFVKKFWYIFTENIEIQNKPNETVFKKPRNTWNQVREALESCPVKMEEIFRNLWTRWHHPYCKRENPLPMTIAKEWANRFVQIGTNFILNLYYYTLQHGIFIIVQHATRIPWNKSSSLFINYNHSYGIWNMEYPSWCNKTFNIRPLVT